MTSRSRSRSIRAYWLGTRSYESVYRLQEKLVKARQIDTQGDTILLLEHQPVITMGKGAKREHILLSEEFLEKRGVQLVETTRGGDVTFHGPGQLVCYPILDLAPDRCDVRRYVMDLLQTMMRLAQQQGVYAGVIDKYPGIWVEADGASPWPGQADVHQPAKLGAVGVRISQWVTMHGFAFNACTDLSGFELIVPCGIREYTVTSIEKLRGQSPKPKTLARDAAMILCERLEATLEGFEDVEKAPSLEKAIGIEEDSRGDKPIPNL